MIGRKKRNIKISGKNSNFDEYDIINLVRGKNNEN